MNRIKLTVDRSRWFRGRGLGQGSSLIVSLHHSDSALKPEDQGKMCCLGFLGCAPLACHVRR